MFTQKKTTTCATLLLLLLISIGCAATPDRKSQALPEGHPPVKSKTGHEDPTGSHLDEIDNEVVQIASSSFGKFFESAPSHLEHDGNENEDDDCRSQRGYPVNK